MYLTAKTCYISTTFDEETANAIIDTEMRDTIERVPSEPYEYTIKDTGKVITLTHTYQYFPERIPAEKLSDEEEDVSAEEEF